MADRAQSTSSTYQQVKAAQNAGKLHDWPEEVGGYDEQTWAIYIKNQSFRAYDDWNDSDLIELARVSKMQALVLYEMEKLEDEGFILMGGKNANTPIENPRNRAISTATSGITSTLRRLGITASNSGGDREAKAKRGQREREVSGGVMSDEHSRSGSALM